MDLSSKGGFLHENKDLVDYGWVTGSSLNANGVLTVKFQNFWTSRNFVI